MDNLTKKVQQAFSKVNEKMMETQMNWAQDRYNKMLQAEKNGAGTLELINVAGGKGWFDVFYGGNIDMVNGHVKKNVTNIINKRDKKVVDALIKNGVNDIPDFKVNHRGDGYHGFFDAGGS